MKRLIDNHKAVSYFMIAFLLSGILVLLQGFLPIAGEYSLMFPQLSPAIAVSLIAIITRNRSIFSEIKHKFFFSKELFKWFPAILLSTCVPIVITSLYLSTQGSPYTPWQGTSIFHTINVMFLLVGVVFEEIGWRGFWLPLLCKKHSLFTSAIIVGIFWGVWHMNFSLGLTGYFAYLLFTTLNSILMAIIFQASKNSLNLIIMWHFLINVSFNIFLNKRVSAESFIVIDLLLGIICIMAVFWMRKLIFKVYN